MVDINEKAFADATDLKKRKVVSESSVDLKLKKRHKIDPTVKSAGDKKLDNKERSRKRLKKNKVGRKMTANNGTNKKENMARLPQTSNDMSSNWKKLLQKMEEENKKSGVPIKHKKTYSQSNLSNNSFRPDKSDKSKEIDKHDKMTRKNSPEIWFDGVDKTLLDQNQDVTEAINSRRPFSKQKGDKICPAKEDPLVKDRSFQGFTKAISMDCEMVGVGYTGSESVLARVSLVNHFGHCVYDKYVKSREKVTDYRTAVSGIRPADIEHANDFKEVQKEVSDILNNRILVGHAIRHDLKVKFRIDTVSDMKLPAINGYHYKSN